MEQPQRLQTGAAWLALAPTPDPDADAQAVRLLTAGPIEDPVEPGQEVGAVSKGTCTGVWPRGVPQPVFGCFVVADHERMGLVVV